MRLVALAFLVAGCGRYRFEDPPIGVVDAATGDAPPPVHVQTVAPDYVLLPTMTVSISVGAGNTLIAATFWDTTPNTIMVTDSSVLTWTPLTALTNFDCFAAPKASGAQLWFAESPDARAIDVTVTQSDTMNRPLGLRLVEYANLDGLEAEVALSATSPTNEMSPGTLATTAPSVTIAIFNNTKGSGTMTPGAGWTERATEFPFYTLVEDNVPGAPAGPVVPTANLPTGINEACWVAAAAAFRIAR